MEWYICGQLIFANHFSIGKWVFLFFNNILLHASFNQTWILLIKLALKLICRLWSGQIWHRNRIWPSGYFNYGCKHQYCIHCLNTHRSRITWISSWVLMNLLWSLLHLGLRNGRKRKGPRWDYHTGAWSSWRWCNGHRCFCERAKWLRIRISPETDHSSTTFSSNASRRWSRSFHQLLRKGIYGDI